MALYTEESEVITNVAEFLKQFVFTCNFVFMPVLEVI